jgi:hypothetical protein
MKVRLTVDDALFGILDGLTSGTVRASNWCRSRRSIGLNGVGRFEFSHVVKLSLS